jgi:hypothetical protein
MVQILEGTPSFGQSMGKALGSGLGEGIRTGSNRAAEFSQAMQMQKAKQKQEDTGLKLRGLESIDQMREILSRGKTGWNFFNYATEEGRADRQAMDTAALNLERLAVEMQGKGTLSKPRFEYMLQRLPSSDKSDAANKSALDEWERILGGEGEIKGKKSKSKPIFDSSNPEHKSKASQLYKTYGDKEKVREKLKLEFEGL